MKLGPEFQRVGARRVHLLFRGSEYGFRMADCHRCVDGQGPTLVLVRTTSGSVFGGYAGGSWASSGGYVNAGGRSFLFSLEEPGNGVPVGVAFTCHDPRYEMSCNANDLAFGGGHDLFICNQCKRNNSSYNNFGNSYGPQQGFREGTHFLVQEGYRFTVADFEVWSVSEQ